MGSSVRACGTAGEGGVIVKVVVLNLNYIKMVRDYHCIGMLGVSVSMPPHGPLATSQIG